MLTHRLSIEIPSWQLASKEIGGCHILATDQMHKTRLPPLKHPYLDENLVPISTPGGSGLQSPKVLPRSIFII